MKKVWKELRRMMVKVWCFKMGCRGQSSRMLGMKGRRFML